MKKNLINLIKAESLTNITIQNKFKIAKKVVKHKFLSEKHKNHLQNREQTNIHKLTISKRQKQEKVLTLNNKGLFSP